MSNTIEPGKTPGEIPKTPSTAKQESSIAIQGQSNGAILPESYFSWSGFVFLISFGWLSATFEDWSVKQQLVPQLAQKLATSGDMQDLLETHLDQLSVRELRALDHLATQSLDTMQLLSKKALENPKTLLSWLKKLASPEGKRITSVKEDEPIKIGGLVDTGISNGVSMEGYLYEISSPLAITTVKNVPFDVPMKKIPFEVTMTHPETGEVRRLSWELDASANAYFESNFKIFTAVNVIENELDSNQNNQYEKQFSDQFNALHPPPSDAAHYVELYQQGNIFMTQDRHPLCFPVNPLCSMLGQFPDMK